MRSIFIDNKLQHWKFHCHKCNLMSSLLNSIQFYYGTSINDVRAREWLCGHGHGKHDLYGFRKYMLSMDAWQNLFNLLWTSLMDVPLIFRTR